MNEYNMASAVERYFGFINGMILILDMLPCAIQLLTY